MEYKTLDTDMEQLEYKLVKEWDDLRATIHGLQNQLFEVEQQMGRILDLRDGRVIKGRDITVERTFSPAYIQNRFTAIKEHLDKKDLDYVYTPAHTVQPKPVEVEEHWDTTKLKGLASDLGGEVKRLFESAKADSTTAKSTFRKK